MKHAKTIALTNKLIGAGLSRTAIQAAWPAWWSDDAADSASAFNDLKFSLSRKLGIAPTSLFDEGDAVFLWHGVSKFKGVSVQSEAEKSVLIGFAHAISRLILSCSNLPAAWHFQNVAPDQLRSSILEAADVLALPQLLGLTRTMGIPVVYLKVFPLGSKRMTAMTVRVDDRYVILVGRDARYQAWLAFYVAHELAHIFNGHLEGAEALVDAEILGDQTDEEEAEADRFALTLLSGQSAPKIEVNRPPRTATELANAVVRTGQERRIDPGTLALCYAFASQDWVRAAGALKCLYGNGRDLWRDLNSAAYQHLDLSRLTDDNHAFISRVLGLTARAQNSSG